MRRAGLFAIAALLAGAPGVSSGADGTTGASSLKLGAGARGQAMGDAYAAMSEGVEALFWNPAGLAAGGHRSLMLGFQPMLSEATVAQAAAAARFGRVGLGVGFNVLQHDDLDAFDEAGNLTGDFKAQDQTIVAGAAYGGPRMSAGVAAKFWRSEIDGESAGAVAADVGLSFAGPLSRRMRHALVVRHLGGKVSYVDQEDPLPTTAVFGTSYAPNKRLSLSLDLASERSADAYVSGGAEWAAIRASRVHLNLRGGYTTRRSDTEGLGGATFGLGVAVRSISFDYAWVPFGDLGDSHAVTLIWRPEMEPPPLNVRRSPSRNDAAPEVTGGNSGTKGKIKSRPAGRRLEDLDPPRRR